MSMPTQDNQATGEPKVQRLSAMMDHLAQLCAGDELTVGEFLLELSVYGHMIICLMFAIPFIFPVPLPGLATIFGFVICMVSFQVIMGWEPWLPSTWRAKKMPSTVSKKMLTATSWILKRIEKFVKPRWMFISENSSFNRINGAVIFVVSVLLSLPMPPGFNAPPALAIVVLCVGSIERDGLLIIAGYVLSVASVIWFAGFFMLGASFIGQ